MQNTLLDALGQLTLPLLAQALSLLELMTKITNVGRRISQSQPWSGTFAEPVLELWMNRPSTPRC